MGTALTITITGELWGALLCFLAYLVLVIYKEKTSRDMCVRNMLLVCTLLLISDAATWYFDGLSGSMIRTVLYLSNYCLYLCGYLSVSCFILYMWLMIKREGEKIPLMFRIFWIAAVVSVLAMTVGIFFDLYFTIDAYNVYHRTGAYYYSQLIAVLGVITLLWAIIRYGKRLTRFELFAACAYVLLPPLGTLIQSFFYGTAFQQFGFAIATLITFYVREADIRSDMRRQLSVIGGLSNACFVCIEGNTDSNTFNVFKGTPYLHEILKDGKCITPDSAFARYIPLGVSAEDREKMFVFTETETLAERTRNTDVITVDFHSIVPGQQWVRASWIAVKRDHNGLAHNYLFIMEEISAEIAVRRQQEDILRTARDQAQAANRAKTTFLFNMSHDIRTPMNAIIGFTDLAEKYYDDKEKAIGYLHKAQGANQFLLSLINNVLEMARIESGSVTLSEQKITVTDFSCDIMSVFEEEMKKKNISFTSSLDVRHRHVLTDPVKLREIYLNIISNACKYTPEGGKVHADVTELPSYRDGYTLIRVKIADTGIGMSPEFLPHVFEEFSRESTVTENKIQGTGLGMPIVKRLVELLGGTIQVESTLGKGSTFTTEIYHKIADDGIEQAEEAAAPVSETATARFAGRRILLAEDNDLNAEIAQEILAEAGFLIDHAADGAICLDMLLTAEAGYYDLILMDIQMPNVDGYQAARTIRALDDPDKNQIPIIAMTANAFDEDKQNALNAGMNAHLAKPIEVPKLMQALAETIK